MGRSRSLQKALRAQPIDALSGPSGAWKVHVSDRKTMPAMRVDVQLDRDTRALHRQIHRHAVVHLAYRIVGGMDEEHRRSIFGDMNRGGEPVLHFEIARVQHDREIRATTCFVDLVEWLIRPLFEIRRRRSNQMAAGRKADHADLLWIDAPFASFASYKADGALGVEQRTQRRLTFYISRPARTAVFQNDSGEPRVVQPRSDFLPFDIPTEVVIAAAGADE